ncbi:MAG: SRPBCC family protein [Saprospiraceae bacterium]|nr:SRPBCC family protein [Saprospiraceae bacterium]
MHRLTTVQFLPISLDKAWDFFSNPSNLNKITPKEMNLIPTSALPEKSYPGMFITYKVKPLLGIPMLWVTEITHLRDKEFFVDEQRIGPYRIWHHQHHFKSVIGGVEMTDIVDYRVPGGPIGVLLEKLFIGSKVRSIFAYRTKVLVEMFGT